MAAAAMAEQESARNGARNRGGVQRVEGKLRASVEKGDYYEAHQMYRTLFFRYRCAPPPPAGPSARPPGPPPRPGRFPLAAPRRPASPLARAAAFRLGGRGGRPWRGRAEGSGGRPDPGRTSASRSPASACPARHHPAVRAASCPPPRPASPPPARPTAEHPVAGPPRAVRLKPARGVSRFSSPWARSRKGLSLCCRRLVALARPRSAVPTQLFPKPAARRRAAPWRVGRAGPRRGRERGFGHCRFARAPAACRVTLAHPGFSQMRLVSLGRPQTFSSAAWPALIDNFPPGCRVSLFCSHLP